MDESTRRLQIALRLKAARYLAGGEGSKGATALSPERLAEHPALVDEAIKANRIYELEQRKAAATRADLDAFVKALGLPADWFAGLYPADRGKAVSGSLGELLQAIAEGARELRQGPAAAQGHGRGRGRLRGAEGDGGG